MNLIDLANLIIIVVGLTTAILGLNLNLAVPYMDKKDKAFFTVMFSLIIIYNASALLEEISSLFLGQDYGMLSQAALFSESLFSSILQLVLTNYLLFSIGIKWRQSFVARLVSLLWIIYFATLVFTQFTQYIYYFTSENVYHRGPFYPVILVPPILIMLIDLVTLYVKRDQMTKRQLKAFSIYIILPLICMVIQMISYGLLMILVGTSVAAFVMFIFMLREHVDRYIRQQEENERQRTSIKILQMRPHFIYNTMTSIYYLCGEDPDKAQKVILDFTNYLRHNFTAISKDEMISFVEELEHVQAYLAVEKSRYEDKLFVDFDTPYTSFRIPPLTIQPVVENAVKYGVSPDMSPLHITVSTRDTGKGAEITVRDTGPGYRPVDDNEPHVALENIKERLEMMCGGKLQIEPCECGGTKVIITIPDVS